MLCHVSLGWPKFHTFSLPFIPHTLSSFTKPRTTTKLNSNHFTILLSRSLRLSCLACLSCLSLLCLFRSVCLAVLDQTDSILHQMSPNLRCEQEECRSSWRQWMQEWIAQAQCGRSQQKAKRWERLGSLPQVALYPCGRGNRVW